MKNIMKMLALLITVSFVSCTGGTVAALADKDKKKPVKESKIAKIGLTFTENPCIICHRQD